MQKLNQILHINILVLYLFAIFLLSVAGLFFAQHVYAAPPGCYSANGSSSGVTYTEIDCPTSAQILVDGIDNRCYVTLGPSEELSDFDEVLCTSFDVGGSSSTTPNTNPATNSGPTGINDPNLETSGTFETSGDDCSGEELDKSNCAIIGYLITLINVLSGLAGIVIVGSIMIAGYTYMTARDNAGQIMKAKMRIVWTLAALALFIFMYGLLNYLVPGGVL